jgi:hypothetical protein
MTTMLFLYLNQFISWIRLMSISWHCTASIKQEHIGYKSKISLDYTAIECNFNIDEIKGLRSDKTINLNGYKTGKLYPEALRLVE